MPVGPLILVCLLAVGLALVLQRRAWERWWFELEDPRSIALFRIILAAEQLARAGSERSVLAHLCEPTAPSAWR